jgi:hypothetical protein
MPEYKYTATDLEGHMIHGVLIAQDHASLAAILQGEQLFLVSWTAVPSAKSELSDSPSKEEEKLDLSQDRSLGTLWSRLRWHQKTGIWVIFLSGFVIGGWQARYRISPRRIAGPKHWTIPLDKTPMTRAEIEANYPVRHEGPQVSSLTRYYMPPDRVITVPYDDQGGPWSPQNRVVGKELTIDRISPMGNSPGN